MNPKIVGKIIEEYSDCFDAIPDEELSTWNNFVMINEVVSKYKGIDCLMNVTFANGCITQGMCVITDWKPGALVLQSDEGDLPELRVVFPEEYIEFMKEIEHIFLHKYPAIPEEQEIE